LDAGSWRLEAREGVRGRGGPREDGELSDRQSENSSRTSFHPFVRSQAVFSHSEDEIQSLSFHSLRFSPLHLFSPFLAKLLSASIVPLTASSLFLTLSLWLLLSHDSVSHIGNAHTHTHTHTKDSPPFRWPRAHLLE